MAGFDEQDNRVPGLVQAECLDHMTVRHSREFFSMELVNMCIYIYIQPVF